MPKTRIVSFSTNIERDQELLARLDALSPSGRSKTIRAALESYFGMAGPGTSAAQERGEIAAKLDRIIRLLESGTRPGEPVESPETRADLGAIWDDA